MGTDSKFEQNIKTYLTSKGIHVNRWNGGTRRSPNLIELRTVPKITVLYTKKSNSRPGFWGLTKNQLASLRKSEVRWFAVLLHTDNPSGYILSANQVEQRVQDGTFELSRDGDYKINENTDFHNDEGFKNIEELFAKVL